MESSTCRPGVSDTEQSAQSYTVTLKYEHVMVKVEPEWGDCGVSEAAATEDLYAGHEVKEELTFGPELVQEQDIAFSMHNAQIIKGELEVDYTHTSPSGAPRCNRSTKQQYGLSSCFVRLKRLLEEELHRCNICVKLFDCKLSLSNHSHLHSINKCGVPCLKGPYGSDHKDTFLKERHKSSLKKRISKRNTSAKKTKRKTLASRTQKKYICSYCNRHFNRKACMVIHERKHTGEKPYICDVCNKGFTIKSTLTGHKRIHAGEKPYICNVCGDRFTFNTALANHMKRHTGEKLYTCDLCQKSFAFKSTMISHTRVHTGEKPYSCSSCDKRYKNASAVARHMRIHTGEKRYSCNVCGRRFTEKSVLYQHLRKKKKCTG